MESCLGLFWDGGSRTPPFLGCATATNASRGGSATRGPSTRNRSGPNPGMSPRDTLAAAGPQGRKPAPGDPAVRGIMGVCLGFRA